jgi:hypothetical protein
MVVGTDPADGAVLTGKGFDGHPIELHLTPVALAKLEAFLAQANMEQAKRRPIQ